MVTVLNAWKGGCEGPMTNLDLQKRTAIANHVRVAKERLATEINEAFFLRHPDWKERYGERGVRLGYEDACFHIDFLSAALEAGEVSAYVDYATWARRMLETRGIAAIFLAESLLLVGNAAVGVLKPCDQDYAAPFVEAAVAACNRPLPAPARPETAIVVFVHALLAGNRNAALNIARESLGGGKPVRDVYLHLLQPAMYEIGRLWETNQITVAREHMATAITQYIMAQLFPLLVQSDVASRGRVVVAGVQGELHQIGAMMVSDILESDGWLVRFLGSNMPHSGILDTIEQEAASVLCISTTILFNIPKSVELIRSVRTRFSGVGIMVGGGAFKSTSGLWREVGADAFAPDLEGAISTARNLAEAAA
jgi:methanogenic corrinoid protein MtbC1